MNTGRDRKFYLHTSRSKECGTEIPLPSVLALSLVALEAQVSKLSRVAERS